MPKVEYDFKISGSDSDRVQRARKWLLRSGKVEGITNDNYTKGVNICYLLLYAPAAAIKLIDSWLTYEFLKGGAPLCVYCKDEERPKVEAELEKILKTRLVKRTKENTPLSERPSTEDIK